VKLAVKSCKCVVVYGRKGPKGCRVQMGRIGGRHAQLAKEKTA
jgi:hypothetical protein